jgi:hypothetical protein
VLGLLSLQSLRFLLKSATTIELKQGLEPNFLKLLRMLPLVLSHTHWQAHQLNIERGVFSSGTFHSHWSIARTNRESQSMHWLIMHANQVIGEVAQMTANAAPEWQAESLGRRNQEMMVA